MACVRAELLKKKTNNKIMMREKDCGIIQGEKGKNIIIIKEKLWEIIKSKKQEFKTKREYQRYIYEILGEEISFRGIESWVYNHRKPVILKENISQEYIGHIQSRKKGYCKHNFKLFCAKCNFLKDKEEGCPVPFVWTTSKQGKRYVYEKLWKEIAKNLKFHYLMGILPSQLAKCLNIDARTLRRCRNENYKFKNFSRSEFTWTKKNSYWLGLFLSDGHIRNNGSNLSFTYQVGSSDVFQGYWYPQYIQKGLKIFQHKKDISKTYLTKNKKYWAFKTNLSSLSPIFCQFLLHQELIKKRKKNKTSGYQKNLCGLKYIKEKAMAFQGFFDGDGHVSKDKINSIQLNIALDYRINNRYLEQNFPLVVTSRKRKRNAKNNEEVEAFILAPASLKNMSNQFHASDIVKQLNFMIEGAHNSIRPDKVHKLISVIKRICSRNYGTYKHCLPIQREIRREAIKQKLLEKNHFLEKRYKIRNNKFLPFRPKWAEDEIKDYEWFENYWNFFREQEDLIIKGYNKKLDFSEGVPLNFKL